MRYLKKYRIFKESILVDLVTQNMSDILESLAIWHNALISSINAEEVDIFETFHLPLDEFKDRTDLESLENNVEFINSLSSIALKKSELCNSDDYSTFLNKPCRFMFIYGINKNELENPEYLLFQSWEESSNKWGITKCYKVGGDVSKFYDKLSSKTIELVDGDINYIYSINGNDWTLQNSEKENDIYKKVFRKEEMSEFLSDRNIKVNVV